MTITITDANGDVEEIKAAVVRAFIAARGKDLELVSAQQACGLLDLTLKSLDETNLDKVDLLGNGRCIRYKLVDIEALIAERTIKSLRRTRGKKTPSRKSETADAGTSAVSK